MVSLINLKIIMEKLAKINNNKRLAMRKVEKIARKAEIKNRKKAQGLEWKLKFNTKKPIL